jgi:hypothetical protein
MKYELELTHVFSILRWDLEWLIKAKVNSIYMCVGLIVGMKKEEAKCKRRSKKKCEK